MLAIASRPGTCALCPLPIVSGELISRDNDRDAWVHARCRDAARRAVPHRPRPRAAAPSRPGNTDEPERGRQPSGEARR